MPTHKTGDGNADSLAYIKYETIASQERLLAAYFRVDGSKVNR